jgi:transcriptional regulator with XRE-family HTH domain
MKNLLSDRLSQLQGDKTQKQFANIIGVPLTSYTNWLLGISAPKVEHLIKICKATGASSDWLLGLSTHRHTEHAPPDAPLEYGAGRAAEFVECPGCTYLKNQLSTVNQTLHNLSLGRSQPARTSGSKPVKY